MPRNRFTETPFKPYVIAIGQLTLAWNDLHEKLAALFCLLMDHQEEDDALIDDTLATPEDWHERDARLIGIWNSSNFDRPRREMLKAVIANSRQDHRKAFLKLIDDMTWVLQRADSLEEMRNNAVHSPLVLIGGPRSAKLCLGRTPAMVLGNPRAIKLAQKDLLTEFRWCRDATLVLRDFVSRIDQSLSLGTRIYPWPSRPSLPNRGQKKTPRSQRSPVPGE
jgi:hypothetical protein